MSFWVSLIQPAGVDLFCTGKKFLVFNMVGRNLKIKYRRSFLGFFWTLLNPMAMALVFYFVFKVILKVQIPHYLAFILSGMLPWSFFSQTLMENMESLVGNIGLLTKVPIPLQVFPFVGSVTNLLTLIFALPILLAASLFTGVSLGPSVIALGFFLATLFFTAYSLSIILSIAFVYFRDLRHIIGITMQLWFYGTPVVYNESMIPEHLRWALYLNPIGTTFSAFHQILVDGQWPEPMQYMVSLSWTIALLTLAIWVRKHLCNNLVEQL
jgi:ABC-type polysaccharide/polyol phosphate export permease